jgi:hypothetical protein
MDEGVRILPAFYFFFFFCGNSPFHALTAFTMPRHLLLTSAMYFAYQYLKYLKGSLTRRKILRHGTSGFTSHPKEGMLRISLPLKIHRLGRV